jgi:hypothetical protein
MFTKDVSQNGVVHAINDSFLLILNASSFASPEFQDASQKIASLKVQFSINAASFDFVIGDFDKLSEIFDRLKRNRADSEKRVDREIRPSSLFIAGAYLEDQISICALNTLAVGYDVFLLNDVTIPRDTGHRETFIARLTQAGVVLSTVQQMFYQWLAVETDQDRKNALGTLLSHPNSI